MNDIERLIAIEEIKKLKARYFRAMDTKDFALYRTVFADDVISDFEPHTFVERPTAAAASRNHNGGDSFVSAAKVIFEIYNSVHHGHMPEIEITSPTTAKGVWAMMDIIRSIDPNAARKGFDGFGHYHETYEKIDGEWKIKTIKLTRLHMVPA